MMKAKGNCAVLSHTVAILLLCSFSMNGQLSHQFKNTLLVPVTKYLTYIEK